MLEKLNQQSTPIKLVMALVLAAIFGGAGYYFVVMPMLEKNKADAATLAAKQKENDELRAFETKVADLDRQILALKQQLEIQKKIVPDEKDADKFIILLQDSANDSGIALRSLIARNVVNREYYTEVPFAIEIDGLGHDPEQAKGNKIRSGELRPQTFGTDPASDASTAYKMTALAAPATVAIPDGEWPQQARAFADGLRECS